MTDTNNTTPTSDASSDPTCKRCGGSFPSYDHLVDHLTDEHRAFDSVLTDPNEKMSLETINVVALCVTDHQRGEDTIANVVQSLKEALDD